MSTERIPEEGVFQVRKISSMTWGDGPTTRPRLRHWLCRKYHNDR